MELLYCAILMMSVGILGAQGTQNWVPKHKRFVHKSSKLMNFCSCVVIKAVSTYAIGLWAYTIVYSYV